jgi:hypothetical protein
MVDQDMLVDGGGGLPGPDRCPGQTRGQLGTLGPEHLAVRRVAEAAPGRSTCADKVIASPSIGWRLISCCQSSVRDSLGGLGGSIAGPPVGMAPAGQTGLFGADLGQGVGDWVEDRGPVKPQPVASHRP